METGRNCDDSTLEKFSGLSFVEQRIGAVVYEWISFSGRSPKDIMRLRASYPRDVKKGTLVHELGHRLLFGVDTSRDGLDEEKVLFLFLHDVRTEVYGKEFADAQVAIESALTGVYDYAEAWKWTLGLGTKGRATQLREVSEHRGKILH
ncbi:hypothetical protein L0Y40_00855 [Candidatus Wolfebacteria bacterium]|nr:hypothetical protein [Candidatus Wolfebacteria bacterium]